MEKGTDRMAAAAPAPPAAAASSSQCRSPRCTAERRGVRRELDSWRHRLMHCVGKRREGAAGGERGAESSGGLGGGERARQPQPQPEPPPPAGSGGEGRLGGEPRSPEPPTGSAGWAPRLG